MASTDREAYIGEKRISPTQMGLDMTDPYTILDQDWATTSFMISSSKLLDADDRTNMYWSTASLKFTDSRPGGNYGINNHPQYTPYADYPIAGLLSDNALPGPGTAVGNLGWGAYYNDAIDDTKQTIYLRHGVAQFNSLFSFITRAFDPTLSKLARTGRLPSALFTAGKITGAFMATRMLPLIAIPILAGRLAHYFFGRSTSSFYTIKPDMYHYWATANYLANHMAVNLGIFPKITNMNADDTQRINRPMVIDQDYLKLIHEQIPEFFTEENYFDILAGSTRAQRLANELRSKEYEALNNGTVTDFVGYLKRGTTGDGRHSTKAADKNGRTRLSDYLDEILKVEKWFKESPDGSSATETDPRAPDDNNPQSGNEKMSAMQRYAQFFDAEFRMGAQFVTYNVDYTGPQTAQITTSTVESQISQKLNSASATVREARFALADGNVIGEMAKTLIDGLKDLGSGLISGLTLDMSNFVDGLMGDGYVNVPEHWQNTVAQLPESTYTMTLMCTYNTPVNRMLKIYVPLACLLAGALPKSIGKAAYTSPYLTQLFDKGGNQVLTGIISSMSITAGSGQNIGFDSNRNPLALDISFTVKNLSSVMHMPMSSGGILETDPGADEDSLLYNYLSVITSQTMAAQIYPSASAKLKAAKLAINLGKWTSPAFWAATTHDSMTNGLMGSLTPVGTVLEAIVRGNETTYGRY